jgi:hypothetical protein
MTLPKRGAELWRRTVVVGSCLVIMLPLCMVAIATAFVVSVSILQVALDRPVTLGFMLVFLLTMCVLLYAGGLLAYGIVFTLFRLCGADHWLDEIDRSGASRFGASRFDMPFRWIRRMLVRLISR